MNFEFMKGLGSGACGWYQPREPFVEANWDWDDEKGFVIGGICL